MLSSVSSCVLCSSIDIEYHECLNRFANWTLSVHGQTLLETLEERDDLRVSNVIRECLCGKLRWKESISLRQVPVQTYTFQLLSNYSWVLIVHFWYCWLSTNVDSNIVIQRNFTNVTPTLWLFDFVSSVFFRKEHLAMCTMSSAPNKVSVISRVAIKLAAQVC